MYGTTGIFFFFNYENVFFPLVNANMYDKEKNFGK